MAEQDTFDASMVPMQRLNITLRELLSMWFSVGFLAVERVTWKSPCEMLQKVNFFCIRYGKVLCHALRHFQTNNYL